ncbi:MAG: hypothetical protein AAGD07_15045 [Planctomycetota bacterium]
MQSITKFLKEGAADLVPRLITGSKEQEVDSDRVNFAYSLRHIGPPAAAATPTLIESLSKQRPHMKTCPRYKRLRWRNSVSRLIGCITT